ncbi:MAG: DNA recombination protein RmuC [Rikenellaceae bacterium]|nr:DNA recombination protein RmuC [Rikenellaceae bacterium]
MVIIILICAAVTAVSMALITLLMNRERTRLINEKLDLEQRLTAEKNDLAERAAAERTTLENRHATERTALEEQLREKMVEVATLRTRVEQHEAEREKMEEQFKAQFRNLANDILGEQSRQFRQTNKDEIDKLLKPFRDNITDFRERVERIYSSENEQRGALRNELENLMKLNARITTETANLTQALKGNSKVQGDWGEMILDSILDNSNLIRGIHYDTQLNIKDAEGNNLRPDVVLYLPEGKQIVIDSKVSLTAYADFSAAEDADSRQRHLTAHIASVRQHVKELGSKEYQRLLQSPDFVIMFVPNEPAFLTALQYDNTIWSDAYDRKVIVSSPTNLFALLKLVDDLWKRNDQSKNTADIVTYGTKLYEQLVAFVTALEGVGQSLEKAQSSYDEAYKRLCTGNDNIIRSGERLRKLGLPTKKQQTRRAIAVSGEESESQE